MSEQENILEIDETRLDEAWIAQPKLYYKYAKQLANARTVVEEIKNQQEIIKTDIDNVKATLDMSIRNNPDGYGIGKTTETAIKNAVSVQPEYKEIMETYNASQKKLVEAKNEADVLQALVTALDHKKSALENLVRLHGQNYFSSPKMAEDESSRDFIRESLKKRARDKVRKAKDDTDE